MVMDLAVRLSEQRLLRETIDLADRLQIGLGSVTRAYALLERRGLTRSVRGRGTFVASQQAQAGEDIDLSSNAPPAAISARVLARTLTGIARSIDTDHFNFYAPPQGHLEHRRVLARWLQTLGLNVEPDHMVLTSSALLLKGKKTFHRLVVVRG